MSDVRNALAALVNVLHRRHTGRMPDEVQRAFDDAQRALAEQPADPGAGYPILDVRVGREVEIGWRWRNGRTIYYCSKEDVDTAERLAHALAAQGRPA